MLSLYYLIFCLLSFWGALIDFLFYKIPNSLILPLMGGGVLKILIFSSGASFSQWGLIFGGTLLGTYVLYRLKILGAGDAKFLSASVLWIPAQNLMLYLILVALLGGGLALFYILCHDMIDGWRFKIIQFLKEKPFFQKYGASWLGEEFVSSYRGAKWSQILLPYGVAIFMGDIALWLLQAAEGIYL